MPNADTYGRIIMEKIKKFVGNNKNSVYYDSLGQVNYLSCLQYVNAVIGNSSSGIIEAPTFKIGTINIGDRQRGRIRAESVIDCSPKKDSIINAFNKLNSNSFQRKIKNVKNPYGEGGASKAIVDVLEKKSLNNIIKKRFYNIRISSLGVILYWSRCYITCC